MFLLEILWHNCYKNVQVRNIAAWLLQKCSCQKYCGTIVTKFQMSRRLRHSFRLNFIKNLCHKSRNVKLNNMDGVFSGTFLGLLSVSRSASFQVNWIACSIGSSYDKMSFCVLCFKILSRSTWLLGYWAHISANAIGHVVS